jgi:broad specificity phosphatase PhoE
MTVIYIRHGNDEENHSKYSNDPRLVKKYLPDIHRLTKRLIRKYGMPDIVCISPMSRAIDTCEQMKKHFHHTYIRVCPELSRFFTSSENTDVAPRTIKLKVPLGESRHDFTQRVHDHIDLFIHKKFYHRRHPVVWCITHALVMKRIAARLNIPIDNHVEFLDHFIV